MSSGIRLGPAELLASWESLELPEPPCQLRLRPRTGTAAAVRAQDRGLRAAMAGLAERGLSDRGRPVGTLAHTLVALGRCDHLLDIRFTGTSRPVLGLGAVRGPAGVIAVSADGIGPVDLYPMDAARVPGALLALLHPIRPKPSPPVSLPEAVFDAARAAGGDRDPWVLSDRLIDQGVLRQDAHAVAVMGSDVCFGGQLGVTIGHGWRARRGPWVVGFVRDRERRHVLQLRRAGTVTVAPADATALLRHWRELLDRALEPGAA